MHSRVPGKAIGNLGVNVWNWISNAVTTTAKALWTWFSHFPTWIWNALKGLAKAIGNHVNVWNWIKNAVVTAANALWTWFGNFGTWIWNALKGLGKAIGTIGTNVPKSGSRTRCRYGS